jgi:hypothetical protein
MAESRMSSIVGVNRGDVVEDESVVDVPSLFVQCGCVDTVAVCRSKLAAKSRLRPASSSGVVVAALLAETARGDSLVNVS